MSNLAVRGSNALGFIGHSPQAMEAMAERLGLMIVNGKKLQPDERLALAAYSFATGLNPFANECYYLPGIGPGPGIAGWRVKAEEQLEYEAQKAGMPAARFWTEYVAPEPGEARFDASKGDIAVKAVLHDDITRNNWERRRLGHFIELVKTKMDTKEAWEIAVTLTGDEPTWSAVGVVRGGESFGGTEKMDRYERACKRAEKAAIRKRFPRVSLPEPVGWENSDVIEGYAVDTQPSEPKQPEQLVGELYGDYDASETIVGGDAVKYSSKMTVDEALKVQTPKGTPLGELAVDQLQALASHAKSTERQKEAARVLLAEPEGEDWNKLYALLGEADAAGLIVPEMEEQTTVLQLYRSYGNVKRQLERAGGEQEKLF